MLGGLSSRSTPADLLARIDSADSLLSQLGAVPIESSPPSSNRPLRRGLLTSSFTSNDVDRCVYEVKRLRLRLESLSSTDPSTERAQHTVRDLMGRVERLAERHGCPVNWDAA